MFSESIKQYSDFIDVYKKLYHMKPNDSALDMFDSLKTILIQKYKMPFHILFGSINNAELYNYRALFKYIKILQCFKDEIPEQDIFTKKHLESIAKRFNAEIKFSSPHRYRTNTNKIYVDELKSCFPTIDSLEDIIMQDDIEKFKELSFSTNIYRTKVKYFISLGITSILEACAYFGSTNIFFYVLANDPESQITVICTELAFVGGNVDIINECMKFHNPNMRCLEHAMNSHNNDLLDDLLDKFNNDLIYFDFEILIYSQNLEALFITCEKNLKDVIHACGIFPQAFDIIEKNWKHHPKNYVKHFSILHCAAFTNNIEVFKYFNNDKDPKFSITYSTKDLYLRTPISIATELNNKEIIEFILAQGALIESNKIHNPLHIAIQNYCNDVAVLFVNHGIDVNFKDFSGRTPLSCAFNYENFEITPFLIEHGADVMKLFNRAITKHYIKFLSSHGKVNIKDKLGKTFLHYAVELLISHGVDINVKDNQGKTALQYATEVENNEIIKLLTSQQCDK